MIENVIVAIICLAMVWFTWCTVLLVEEKKQRQIRRRNECMGGEDGQVD